MKGTFGERSEEIAAEVGGGVLHGQVVVDQVYAHYQHERLDLKHPRGGGPNYLRNPFYSRVREYLQRIADRLPQGRVGMIEAMGWSMEQLCTDVTWSAPVEFSDLRFSGHPTVTDDGVGVYDRPAIIHRLSEDEIRAKNRQRRWGV